LYNLPLEHWWESTMDDSVGEWLNLGQEAPYTVLLAVIALVSFASIWLIVEMIQASPWGRILRAIREDEEVTMHHGHNVFQHKAMCLALGAAIGGFGGALWAWLNSSVLDDFINPINSTFLIWAAFIVGGRANNRGMVIGAFIIALTQPFFNLLSAARGDTDSMFHDYISDIDGAFGWFFLDIMGLVSSDLSMVEVFGTTNPEKVVVNMTYFKLMLIGIVILSSLLISERGLLPEVPKRPVNPDLIEPGIPWFVWALVAAIVLIIEIVILGVI
jgi:ABC-type branched-subunit amino acid transport system permease subunit